MDMVWYAAGNEIGLTTTSPRSVAPEMPLSPQSAHWLDGQIAQHGAWLFALCRKLMQNHADAQDLYQETWLKAYKFREKYDAGRPFPKWIATICMNAYRDDMRKRKLRSLLPASTRRETHPVSSDNAESDALSLAIAGLPEKYRTVLVMYYFQDRSIRETSEIMALTEGAVKTRLDRARNMLKERMNEHG